MIQPLALSPEIANKVEIRRRTVSEDNIHRILSIAREVAEDELAPVVEKKHYAKAMYIISYQG